ncbi:uncharacterized protein L203_100493 [Cryptococcus depauperatus CBS 7841]|uniref:Uncharacterized protein n=1 Tax=Cryptococcus depauperatus CBS 7841 TaxID=1295531 RepID=A0AAJ8LXX6_9TREE
MELRRQSHQKSKTVFDLGKKFFVSFFEKRVPYMSCFDPDDDTGKDMLYDITLQPSLFVALKCEEAGGPTNSTQLKVQGQAEKIAMDILYTFVARNGIVQIMTILVSWGEIFWRPAGHAVRMAMDLCLYRCLPYLIEKGIRSGEYPVVLVDERPVAMGTGTWFTLFKMSFAFGHPVILHWEIITNVRQLLNHPLSISTDIHLVSTYLQQSTGPVHRHLTFVYARRDIPTDHFLRETLVTGCAGTFLGANSYVLHEVRNRRDFASLSDEHHGLFHEAGEITQQLVSKCLGNGQYNRSFQSVSPFKSMLMCQE